MKNLIATVIMVLCLALFGAFSLIAAPPEAYLAREGGDIKGSLSYCGTGGSEGIEVYIPGTSFLARTDASGQFRISYVPPGTWTLVFAKNGKKLGAKNDVQVLKTNVTLIDQVVICNDMDGDGFDASEDCNDNDPTVYPGAPEICGDGKDNNCNGIVDENCPPQCTDKDGDGYYAEAGCGTEVDCDDNDATIHPGAQEICDGKDNNCDGVIDEPGAVGGVKYYRDKDNDGYGDDNDYIIACNPPSSGYVTVGGDCNDGDSTIHPGAPEIIGDGKDNDCDGQVDEPLSCLEDPRLGTPCDGPDIDLCPTGVWVCGPNNELVCNESGPGTPEIPGNGVDDDCNPNTPD